MAVLIACLFIGGACLAVVGYLRAARRDSRSVEHYKATLGHLRHVAEQGRTFEIPGRPVPPHVRIMPREGGGAEPPEALPAPLTPSEPASKSEPPMVVFVDEPDLPTGPLTPDPEHSAGLCDRRPG
jgi:hypothetical protein